MQVCRRRGPTGLPRSSRRAARPRRQDAGHRQAAGQFLSRLSAPRTRLELLEPWAGGTSRARPPGGRFRCKPAGATSQPRLGRNGSRYASSSTFPERDRTALGSSHGLGGTIEQGVELVRLSQRGELSTHAPHVAGHETRRADTRSAVTGIQRSASELGLGCGQQYPMTGCWRCRHRRIDAMTRRGRLRPKAWPMG